MTVVAVVAVVGVAIVTVRNGDRGGIHDRGVLRSLVRKG
jgi:predicted RecA/RadA family phage recombinase